ncbi:MAG: ABC transporter substrate-binding protein [Pseudomonadota bacterium]
MRVFLEELRRLGHVEGEGLIVERRSAEGRFERFGEIVAGLAAMRTEVIVCAGDNSLYRRARDAAGGVPIVMIASSEPDRAGLVASLARPGGTVTGLTIDIGPEIEAKRMEILKEALPGASRVAYLARRAAWEHPYALAVRATAKKFGVALVHVEHTPDNYASAFDELERNRPDALFASFSAETFGHRQPIAEFTLRARLPGIFPYREITELGGLMSYGTSAPDLFRKAASYVDRILRGAKPGDLPIERPTRFDFVVNLRTARALGIPLPRSILLRADRVIE